MGKKRNSGNHLIVISYDAFSADQWEPARRLPHLARLIANGAAGARLKTVYPSFTYVIHSTFVTGVYPDKHGVYHNNPLQPFVPDEEQRWFWLRRDIQAPTVVEAARKHGLRTAALLWPVTGKAAIDYNIPEIRALKGEHQALKILRNGSPWFSLQMEWKYGKVRRGITQPYLDDFTTRCAVDTIKNKQPHLLLLHLIELDDAKHAGGTTGPHIDQTLARMDRRIGAIVQAVEDAGLTERTTFLIVGDHGQKDVRYKVHLNKLLLEKGLIYAEAGEPKWRAYVQGAGGSAYLHIRDGDEEAERLAVELLEQAMGEERYGIEALYTRKELDGLHVAPQFRYMLEAKVGYCFEDATDQPVVVDLEALGRRYATHGYSPDKPDYRSVLVVSGRGIKPGGAIGDCEVVDIAPTMARILGIDFGRCDGRVLDEIFADGQGGG